MYKRQVYTICCRSSIAVAAEAAAAAAVVWHGSYSRDVAAAAAAASSPCELRAAGLGALILDLILFGGRMHYLEFLAS